MGLAETIYHKSLDLPAEKAIEVIDFIDFIKDRLNSPPLDTPNAGPMLSCFDLIEEDIGSVADAPSDLSTNPGYLQGYGR